MIQGGNMRFAKMNTGVQLTPANTEDWFCANDKPKVISQLTYSIIS